MRAVLEYLYEISNSDRSEIHTTDLDDRGRIPGSRIRMQKRNHTAGELESLAMA